MTLAAPSGGPMQGGARQFRSLGDGLPGAESNNGPCSSPAVDGGTIYRDCGPRSGARKRPPGSTPRLCRQRVGSGEVGLSAAKPAAKPVATPAPWAASLPAASI